MIPVNTPLLNGNERAYLLQCLETGWVSSEGPFIREFEEKFASISGRKFGIAVCNGSAALDAAIAALNIGPGDEVIMPAFTIISCASAIVRAGATPVLVDSDPASWNMNVHEIEGKITSKTRAILAVHIYGLPVDMDAVFRIAEKHGLKIIEDAAEAHGQTYRGQPCGSFGDLSTFSFYPNKLITTGEGGMIVTDNPDLAERCRSLRNLCFQPKRRFVHEELGWNFRMTNLQAALGLAQLERLEEFRQRKRELGAFYQRSFKNLSNVQLPMAQTDFAENIYWVFGLVVKEEVGIDAVQAMKILEEKGIGTRPFFFPMHQQPVFRKMGFFSGERYPIAENLGQRGFYLPSGLGLTQNQMEQVVIAVKEILP